MFVALVVGLGACAGSTDSAPAVTAADEQSPGEGQAEVTVGPEVDEAAAQSDDGASDDEASVEDDAQDQAGDEVAGAAAGNPKPLPPDGPLEPGTYTTDVLGTPITLSTTEELVTVFNVPGMVLVESPNKASDFSEGLLLFRATGLAGGDEGWVVPPPESFGGDATDIAGWAQSIDGVDIVAEHEHEVDANPVTSYTLAMNDEVTTTIPDGCGPAPDSRCYFFASTTSWPVSELIVRDTETYRVWVVDDRADPPLLAFAPALSTEQWWLDAATGIVESLELGEVADPPPAEIPEAPEGGGVLDVSFAPLGPGEWIVESLGIPLTFTTHDDSWVVQPNEPAFLALSHPDSVAPDDRDVVFLRVQGLARPIDFNLPVEELNETPSWPLDDLAGWIDALPETVSVTGVETTEIGGLPATSFAVEVADDHPCGPQLCVPFVGAGHGSGKSFSPGIPFEVHWIDGGEQPPLAIVVGGGHEDPDSFFTTANELIATIQFGEPGPHPIAEE